MADTRSGWFSYSPLNTASVERLTEEQRKVLRRHQDRHEAKPIGEVHVLIYDLAPGQCEIRFGGTDNANAADLLPIAIQELEGARAIFSDLARNDLPGETSHD